ncbi:MAG: MFS transporter, partial [Caldilineaceae bacterium]|nr:MFS transporter [Caldilineaceae bacterium]
MTTSTVEDRAEQIAAAEPTATFQTDQVFTVAGGHFIHDTYSAFIAPLIPLLQERLGVGYAGAGSLAIYAQMPSLLNPFIGYLADRVSLRYFIILAPAVTATLMSCMGLTSNYLALAMLMLAAGVSMAAFHAPAPAMIGRLAGQRTGTGMSIFMASGELGRTVGPLFVTAGVAWFGLEGIWRLAAVGWITSVILYWKLHTVSARPTGHKNTSLQEWLPLAKRIFPFLAWLMLGRALINA